MITNEYGVQEIQMGLLSLMKIFDNYCREHSINYTLHGGSLLGAIREKGFIPWDDDIDLGMTRENYEKLKMELAIDKPENMYLDYDRDKIKKIWCVEKGKQKIWLDIFIYDYISEKRVPQKIKLGGLKFLTAFTKSKATMAAFRTNNRAKGMSRMVFELIYLLGKPFPLSLRLNLYDWFSKTAFTGKKELIHRANDQLVGIGLIIPKEAMEKYESWTFEDTTFMVMADYNSFLIPYYGKDYMTPKKDNGLQRKVHNLSRDHFENKQDL